MVALLALVMGGGGCRAESEVELPKACDDYLAAVRRCGGGESPEAVKRRLGAESDVHALELRCANAARSLERACR